MFFERIAHLGAAPNPRLDHFETKPRVIPWVGAHRWCSGGTLVRYRDDFDPGDHGSVTLNVKQQFGEIVDKI